MYLTLVLCKLSKCCTLCGESKPLEAFHIDQRNKSGRTARCAICRTKAQIALQSTQKQTQPEHYRRWRKSNNYSSKYGLTLDEVEKKLVLQDSTCPICLCSLEINSYAVDHCHTTGQVRDLLCASCNKGLGFFYESLPTMERAMQYLKRFGK